MINTQEEEEPALTYPSYNGMLLAPPFLRQCPIVELSGIVGINVQPADAEAAKSKLLVKAPDNTLK